MTLKQRVEIGTVDGKPVYPTTEFIQEINRMNAGNLAAALLNLQTSINEMQVTLESLNDRVSALE